jgi:hypothetical protein
MKLSNNQFYFFSSQLPVFYGWFLFLPSVLHVA